MNKKINANRSFKFFNRLNGLLIECMKVFALLICLGLSSLYANNSDAQTKINIDLKNATFEEFFNEIQSKSDFVILYKDIVINNNKRITIKKENTLVKKILDKAFRGTDLYFKIIDNQIIVDKKVTVSKVPEAPDKALDQQTITGSIKDKDGVPIIGATVLIKGTQRGVATDFDGNFTITAGETDVLVVSSLGFSSKEIPVGNQTNIDIVLEEDVSKLDEIVVVAYGTTKREAFTGSASFIETEQIQESATSNLSQALQGLSPGVQVISQAGRPGADAAINIRGFTSFGNTQPLIILNGSPFEGSLSSIAPSEIESISVLKDASSTSLYGSRASGGVILITTKTGRPGKTQINFRQTLGTSDFAVKLPNKLDAGDQYEAVWEGFYYDNINRGQDDTTARTNASAAVTDRFYIARPHTNWLGVTRQYRSNWNLDEPVGLDGKIKPEAEEIYSYDWYDVFQPKLRQEYSLDVSTGTEKTSLFFATSYLNDKGQYFNQNFERWSSRLNATTKLGDRFTLEANMFYVQTNQDNPGEFTRVIRTIPQAIHPYEFNHETGEFFTDVFGNLALQKGGGQSYSGRRFFGGNNPFDYVNAPKEPDAYRFDINSVNQFINKLALGVDIVEGLNFKTSFIADFRIFERHQYGAPVSGILEVDGFAFKSSSSRFAYTLNNILNYGKSFGDHNFNLLLGHEVFNRNNANLSGRGTVFAVPGLFEIDATSAEPTSGSNENDYRLVSGFSRLTYDYKNKIYLNGSFRADGSSKFAPQNRWGYFWSAGGAWRLSEEDFLNNSNFVNNLKLKASYGTTGNDGDALYAYQALYNTGFNFYENSGAIESRLPTEELIWEKNIQLNTGIEFQLFDRLRGNIEYFTTTSDGLIFNRPLPPSFGISNVTQNIGKIQNKGFEIELGYNIINNNDFKWDINANATHFKNEIKELPDGDVLTGVFKWSEGQSRFDFWLPTWAGVDPDTGDNTWFVNEFDSEGNITGQRISNNWGEVNRQENFAYQGTSIPDVFGSVTNIFKYRGFDLSVMFYYSFGGLMYDSAWRENTAMRNAFGLIDYYRDNHWTPENRFTDIPRPSVNNVNNRRGSSQWLFNNDFVRLRNLNIGYTFPKSFNKALNIQSFRLFFQGDNLVTWGNGNDRGTDPEIAGFDGTSDYNWGIRKTFSAGINVQF